MATQPETGALICAARAGSVAAFEELLRLHQDRVFAFACVLCRDREDAREITQDTFVRAFNALDRCNPSLPFTPWLFAIARRRFTDQWRRQPRIPAEPATPEYDLNTPVEQLVRREEAAEIWSMARRHLSPVQFEALWLRYAEDLPVQDIARVLDRTRTHIKVILFRARCALAAALRHAEVEKHNAATCINLRAGSQTSEPV